MSKELIYKDDAIEAIKDHIKDIDGDDDALDYIASNMLKDVPTIDAVSVVRCKDCKRGETAKCPMYVAKFGYTDQDYCSCGERKDNEID